MGAVIAVHVKESKSQQSWVYVAITEDDSK